MSSSTSAIICCWCCCCFQFTGLKALHRRNKIGVLALLGSSDFSLRYQIHLLPLTDVGIERSIVFSLRQSFLLQQIFFCQTKWRKKLLYEFTSRADVMTLVYVASGTHSKISQSPNLLRIICLAVYFYICLSA